MPKNYRVKKPAGGFIEGQVVSLDDATAARLGDNVEAMEDGERVRGLPTVPVTPRDVQRVAGPGGPIGGRPAVTPSTVKTQPGKATPGTVGRLSEREALNVARNTPNDGSPSRPVDKQQNDKK